MMSFRGLKVFSTVVVVVLVFMSCATATHSEDSAAANASTFSQTSDRSDRAGALDIVKPRNEAIEYVKEQCHNNYEILSERMETAEIGVSAPVGKSAAAANPRWFIRYRCGSAGP